MPNQSEQYQFSIDPTGDITVDIVEAVAGVRDSDPLSGPPLTESVDVDALSRILAGPGPVAVTFCYEDCEVRLDSRGNLQVRRPADDVTLA